jgi:hypothetical protein
MTDIAKTRWLLQILVLFDMLRVISYLRGDPLTSEGQDLRRFTESVIVHFELTREVKQI